MKIPVNFALLRNPVNWAIVLLTVLIGSFALHTVFPPPDNS